MFYRQINAMDCGPTCVRMVAKHYGKHFNAETIRKYSSFGRSGVSLLGISDAAEKIGMRTIGVVISSDQLFEVSLPAILHWNSNHFVVLVEVKKNSVRIADPGKGIIVLKFKEFLSHWLSSKDEEGVDVGIALLLEPTPEFFSQDGQKESKISWENVSRYLLRSKWQIIQVFTALLISSLLALIFPFLTQTVIDIGIGTNNLQYVTVVLIAQLMLTLSQSVISFVQSRLLLRISCVLNIQILSDFWIKLTRLPISYFATRHTGDTLQRIGDHNQIQKFLTGTALTATFSVFNFVVYAIVLTIYSFQLFLIFCIGSILYFIWVRFFLKVRKKLNYEMFHISAKESDATLQLIQGMQEIRFNNAEKFMRWDWETIKANAYKLAFKNLNYSQLQQIGANFINTVQGITISFIVAKLVIDGMLSLGAMLAVQYVVGQLSGPIQQWVGFIQSAQDAKISMERLNEVHRLDNEEDSEKVYLTQLPDEKSIYIENLSFTYPGAGNTPALSEIDLLIPQNKVTAIVGTSGSGKTTLIKILMKVYDQYSGSIKIGKDMPMNPRLIEFGNLKHTFWRDSCGAVLQDGFIFNDTVARNIAVGKERIDFDRLIASCEVANILSFIESLPNGFYTKIGADGTGISQGQRQRILIARAVYKMPDYLFFDEATNALDANNERQIIENLRLFSAGKTVIVVAHRLSTVRDADKIVVLESGFIVEEGTHEELSSLKGKYYELVKNQLELGS